MLELSWRGANEIPLADGQVRKFLQDGDAPWKEPMGLREWVGDESLGAFQETVKDS